MKKINYLSLFYTLILMSIFYGGKTKAQVQKDSWQLSINRNEGLPQKCVMQRDVSLQHLSKKKVGPTQFSISAVQSPYNPFEIQIKFPPDLDISSLHIQTPLPLSGGFQQEGKHSFVLKFIYLPRMSDRKALLANPNLKIMVVHRHGRFPLTIPMEEANAAYAHIYNVCFPNKIRGSGAIKPFMENAPPLPKSTQQINPSPPKAEKPSLLNQQLLQLNPETIMDQFMHNDVLEKYGIEVNPEL